MTIISGLLAPATYHILFYGLLLGTQFYQSFIGGIVAFRALPRAQFSQLQQKIFPIYFALQTALPLLVLLTTPHLPNYAALTTPYFSTVMKTMGVCFLTGLVNMAVVGPATTRIMRERKKQETKEGKKYWEEGEKTVEMRTLNKRFGMVHGVSSLLNLVGLGATVAYAGVLGGRL